MTTDDVTERDGWTARHAALDAAALLNPTEGEDHD